MATYNAKLECLDREGIETVSKRYLMGWHDLYEYGFRLKGLNRRRAEYGLPVLTKEMSMQYRISYIQEHYSEDMIKSVLSDYMRHVRLTDARWTGIEVFDCRFGREYTVAFKMLMGSTLYRKVSEECRVQKLTETQTALYGGVGLAGDSTKQKAICTNLQKYGSENVMHNDIVKQKLAESNQLKYGGSSPFCSSDVRDKAMHTKLSNIQSEMERFRKEGLITNSVFKKSINEQVVFYELIKRFGKSDVYYEYGIHPYDSRYPFSCDFYIKSMDLFIELNMHFTHGGHWFDADSHDDCLRKAHLLQSGKKRNLVFVKTWCEKDVEKRMTAKKAGLRYLVFWDSSCHYENKKPVFHLNDFYMWLYDYDCQYDSFVKDHPENTY